MRNLHLTALLVTMACASSGGGSTSSSLPARPPTDRNVITQTELGSVASTNLYELIEKIRPNFLRSRGDTFGSSAVTYPAVYVDGRPYGDLASLRSLITSQVSEVRYYDAPAAAAKFGSINAPGVIDVHIRQ